MQYNRHTSSNSFVVKPISPETICWFAWNLKCRCTRHNCRRCSCFQLFLGKIAVILNKCGFSRKWTAQRVCIKLKPWVDWYVWSMDFNFWSNPIMWDYLVQPYCLCSVLAEEPCPTALFICLLFLHVTTYLLSMWPWICSAPIHPTIGHLRIYKHKPAQNSVTI